MNNRLARIKVAIGDKEKLKSSLEHMLGELRGLSEHEVLTNEQVEGIAKAFKRMREKLDSQICTLKGFKHEDFNTALFMVEFSKSVGEEFELNAKELENAKERFKQQLPPGDKDDDKPSDKAKYSDYIIWQEILRQGKADPKPLIFVSLDGTTKKENKTGWFYKSGDMIVGAHPYLVKEYYDATGHRCVFYTPNEFMEQANEILEKEIASEGLIKETAEIGRDGRSLSQLSDEEWLRRGILEVLDNLHLRVVHAIEQLNAVMSIGSIRAYDGGPISFISSVIDTCVNLLNKIRHIGLPPSSIDVLEDMIRPVMEFNCSTSRNMLNVNTMIKHLREFDADLKTFGDWLNHPSFRFFQP